jgi:phosphoglycerate dehydrogenase-like enzyme
MTTPYDRIRLHIKNNRAGEQVFRITPQRLATASESHPEVAHRIDSFIDWDFDNFEESMKTANALVTWDLPTENLAQIAPNLRWIHIIGAGVEHLQPIDWLPRGVTLTNNRGVHALKTAESAVMAVMMLNIGMPRLFTDQRNHRWNPRFSTPIAGKTIACIGVGEMGGAAARRFKQLGLKVIGVRRSAKPRRYVDTMYAPAELKKVLSLADFVHVTLPQTPETIGLIGAAELDAMKPGAGIVNFGRARVIDYPALVERLVDGRIGGAILDVHDPEPLPADSPFWDIPNLIITPHVTSDDDVSYIPLTLDLVFENLGRMLRGKPFKNRVNPGLGY